MITLYWVQYENHDLARNDMFVTTFVFDVHEIRDRVEAHYRDMKPPVPWEHDENGWDAIYTGAYWPGP